MEGGVTRRVRELADATGPADPPVAPFAVFGFAGAGKVGGTAAAGRPTATFTTVGGAVFRSCSRWLLFQTESRSP